MPPSRWVSLPRYLRKDIAAFPADHAYLKPDLGEQVRWHGVFAGLGASPAIGLCWRSGKSGGHRAVQYAPLAAWAEFHPRPAGHAGLGAI